VTRTNGTLRFRYGMKSLFVAMTVMCALLALVAQPIVDARRQRQLLNHVAVLGGRVSFLATMPREASFPRGLLALANASYARDRLYGLDFSGTKLGDDDLQTIATIRHVAELNLGHTLVTDAGLRQLSDMEYLRRLDLGGTQVTDQGVAHLRPLNNLASLRVVGTPVTYAALDALDAELPYAHFCEEKAIEELVAAGIQVVDSPRHVEVGQSAGVGLIRAGNEAVYVVVGMNRPITLSRQDVVGLSQLQSLREMTFHTVKLGPDGLADLRPLARLDELSFWITNVSDRDLATLALQTQLKKLTIYDADSITDKGLSRLNALNNLEDMRISNCGGITAAAVVALQADLPNCRIDYSPEP